ncbi:MAG: GNAT family N-acetyltransferase [Chloroflexi bacterium]|nr:GNAT family N-acetyltransferase [Chloroflexota bacterium]
MCTVAVEPLSVLTPEWDALLHKAQPGSVFLRPLWYELLSRHQINSANGSTFSVREEGRLVGVAPLLQVDGRVAFAGDPDLMDYLDVLALPGREECVWSALIEHLEAQPWTSIDLIGLRDGSPALSYLPALCERKGWRVETSLWDVAPQVLLPSTWDEFLSSLSKKDRHELRRKQRRLQQAGEVRYRVVDGREGSLPEEMERFLHLMRQSREEKAEFLTQERSRFFHELAETLARAGLLRLFFLDLGGVPVAGAVCFEEEDTLFLYNSGFDTSHRALSVGLLLKAHCIAYAIEHGKRRFDFLRGDEPYKYDLGGVDQQIHRYTITRGSER